MRKMNCSFFPALLHLADAPTRWQHAAPLVVSLAPPCPYALFLAQLKRSGAVSALMTAQTNFIVFAWWTALHALGLGPRATLTNLVRDGAGLKRIADWMREGKVKMPRVQRLPAAEAAKAHEVVGGKHAGGKVVLNW